MQHHADDVDAVRPQYGQVRWGHQVRRLDVGTSPRMQTMQNKDYNANMVTNSVNSRVNDGAPAEKKDKKRDEKAQRKNK